MHGTCMGCRMAKVKCDKMRPCGRCLSRGDPCVSTGASQRGKRKKKKKRKLSQEAVSSLSSSSASASSASASSASDPNTAHSPVVLCEEVVFGIFADHIEELGRAMQKSLPPSASTSDMYKGHFGLKFIARLLFLIGMRRMNSGLLAIAFRLAKLCKLSPIEVMRLQRSDVSISKLHKLMHEKKVKVRFLQPAEVPGALMAPLTGMYLIRHFRVGDGISLFHSPQFENDVFELQDHMALVNQRINENKAMKGVRLPCFPVSEMLIVAKLVAAQIWFCRDASETPTEPGTIRTKLRLKNGEIIPCDLTVRAILPNMSELWTAMSWRRVSSAELERAARAKKPKRGSAMRDRVQQHEDAFQLDFSEILPFVDLDWENLIGF